MLTAAEIILDARRQVDDLAKPYLRDDDTFLEDLNEAVREACRRGRLIVDSTTQQVCELQFNDGDVVSKLDERVIFVRRIKWRGRSTPLQKTRREDMDARRPGWEDDTASEPTHYVAGMESGAIRPYPTPDAAGIFDMTVVREPLDDIEIKDIDKAEPDGIPIRARRNLVEWLKYRYYSTQDSETNNDAKAAKALAAFEAEFGKASTAQDEIWLDQQHGMDENDGTY